MLTQWEVDLRKEALIVRQMFLGFFSMADYGSGSEPNEWGTWCPATRHAFPDYLLPAA